MSRLDLIDRLARLPNLESVPREELQWLVDHGRYEALDAGTVIGPKGERIESLWIVLSGHISIRVDRGVGPRRVTDWRAGEVSGMLPYSRMKGPPGDNYLVEATELVIIPESCFPEMVHRCPAFTAYTVHTMLDRARNFNTSDLHDEKMISLGKLAAGLAHELNNPASATVRCAKLLLGDLAEIDAASRALGAAGLTGEQYDAIERVHTACLAGPRGPAMTPLERADREDEIADWLSSHDSDAVPADRLADTAVTLPMLDQLATAVSGPALAAGLRWIVADSGAHMLAGDIEQAAGRIYELVAAVKRFTFMDSLAGPELVDVEPGIRDTIEVLSSKANAKSAVVQLDVGADLPRVLATGSELNQVWMSLLDNALDAISDSGRIEVEAREELDRVVVRVIDDGMGIEPEVLPKVFDPFFTTKSPGQGTGLGLEIARRLVRRYRGEITAQSRPGRTEFRVSLPAQNADAVTPLPGRPDA
jgi:signal transduction histidine kinase